MRKAIGVLPAASAALALIGCASSEAGSADWTLATPALPQSLPSGTLDGTDSERVRAALERVVPDVLGNGFVDDRLLLDVRFDDGILQAAVDERYGDDAVDVISSLVPTVSGVARTWVPRRATLPAAATGHGLVIDDGDGARICLGATADSYVPQCEGPPLVGWAWSAVDGEESVAGVTWGEYRVRGVWDGEVLILDRPPVAARTPTATYDPTTSVPSAAPDPTCASVEARLPELRAAVPDIIAVGIDSGQECVMVAVPYDDGTLQAAVDERFGEGAIEIGSRFTPLAEW